MCQMGDEVRSLWEMSYWTVLLSPVCVAVLGLGSMAGRLCSRRAWWCRRHCLPAVIVGGDRGPALDSGR